MNNLLGKAGAAILPTPQQENIGGWYRMCTRRNSPNKTKIQLVRQYRRVVPAKGHIQSAYYMPYC